MSWHIDRSLCGDGIFRTPVSGDGLVLGKEVNSGLTVEVKITEEGALVTGEGEHWERDRNRDVDTDLTGLDFLLELVASSTGVGEDGGAVTIFVSVDQGDGIVKVLLFKNNQDWTKDLLIVASHAGLNAGDDGWTDKVTVRVTVSSEVTAIKSNGGTLLFSRIDDVVDTLLGLWGDDWTDVGALFKTARNLELLGTFTISWTQLLVSPTVTKAERAMHRWPAAPKAAPTMALSEAFLLASGRRIA